METQSPPPALSRLDALAQSPERLVLVIMALLAVAWTITPSLVNLAPPLDVVEGYMWGREWPLATYKHPALPAWAIEASRVATGGAIGWPVYVVAQLFVAATLWLVFLLGRDLMGAPRAAVAAVSLSVLEHLSWRAPEFNHTIAQLPFWVAVALATWRASTTGRTIWWLVLGGVAAGGLYAKLSNGAVAVVAAGWLLSDPRARRQLTTAGPWLGAAVCALLALPLLVWLKQDGLQPLAYAQARGGDAKASLGTFALRVVLVAAPVLAMLAVAGLGRRSVAATADHRARRFAAILSLAPIVLVLAGALASGNGLRTTWSAPMLILMPIALLALFGAPPLPGDMRRFTAVALAAGIALPLGTMLYQLTAKPRDDGPTRINWPERAIAATSAAAWRNATGKPLGIVAGDTWAAGLAGLRHPDKPSILTHGDLATSPWITRERLARQGALIIYDPRRPLSEPLQKLIGTRPAQDLVLPPLPARANVIRLRVVVIPPA